MSSLDVNVCFLDAAEGKIYIDSDRLCPFLLGELRPLSLRDINYRCLLISAILFLVVVIVVNVYRAVT